MHYMRAATTTAPYDAAVSVDTGGSPTAKKTVYSAICTALYEHFDAAGDTGRTEELSERNTAMRC